MENNDFKSDVQQLFLEMFETQGNSVIQIYPNENFDS